MNNRGKDKDALVAARSSVCSMIELRQNNRYDDPALQAIELLPGKPIAMRPTARHLRLIGLTRELKSGDRFSLILDFLNAGEVEVEAEPAGEGHLRRGDEEAAFGAVVGAADVTRCDQ